MRTHRAKSAHLPAEYIPLPFLTRTPSPYSAGWRWGLLSRKIFFDFYFPDFARNLSDVWIEIIFWILHSLFLSRKIFFIFSKHCFNSSSFHPVFLISFYLFSFYTRLITIWSLLHIVENNGFDMILDYDSDFASDLRLVLLASSYVDSMLWLFNSLSLRLFCLL